MTINGICKLIDNFYKICLAYSFNKNEFNLLPIFSPHFDDVEDMILSKERQKYLSQFTKINEGSTRNAHILSSKKVLKVATDKYGIDQNKIECQILTNFKSILLPHIYDFSKDYSWIEVELVRPLNNDNEIKQLTGIDGKDFSFILKERIDYKNVINKKIQDIEKNIDDIKLIRYKSNQEKNNDIKYLIEKQNKWKSYLNNKYLENISQLVNKSKLDPWEFGFYFNLGKSSSGNLVILDVGKIIGFNSNLDFNRLGG